MRVNVRLGGFVLLRGRAIGSAVVVSTLMRIRRQIDMTLQAMIPRAEERILAVQI